MDSKRTTTTPMQPAVAQAFKDILASFGFKQEGHTWRLGRVEAQIAEYPSHNSYRAIFTRGREKSYSPFFGVGCPDACLRFGQKKWLKGEIRKSLRQLHEEFAPYPSENISHNSLAIPHNLR